MSLPASPDSGVGIPSIFSLFPAAKSPSGSTSSSNGQLPVPNFSPPIPSFFPPNNSPSSSESAQVKQSCPSISSLFPPTHSQSNSLSSTRSFNELANSICSIFRPNHSYSSSSESTHDQFTSKRSKLDHEFEDVSSKIEPHFQKPNKIEDFMFKINTSHEEKIFPPQACSSSSTPSRPTVLNDSQDFRRQVLHQTLIACAKAVQLNNLTSAEALVKQINYSAGSQAGAMRKVTAYFTEALSLRIYGQNPLEQSLFDVLQMHLQLPFYETCPYLKFAHFTANQAILEAFKGKKRVHIIDFSMNQGMQWPALMQALALRPGGPPAFRLVGIRPPEPNDSDHLQEVGWKLAQLAEAIHVEFEYRGFIANSLADLDASMLELRPSEVDAVVVNSVFELHKLLARPRAIEKVLSVVKQMKLEIMTVVEQEANHNGPVFLDRSTESLHYYSTMFDSLEGSVNSDDKVMSGVYLGRCYMLYPAYMPSTSQGGGFHTLWGPPLCEVPAYMPGTTYKNCYLGKQICNVVACEGVDRVERHETLTQWRTWMESAGFAPVHLGSNAFKEANMLLALVAGGEGYRVKENNGSLMLGWHTRPLALMATSVVTH